MELERYSPGSGDLCDRTSVYELFTALLDNLRNHAAISGSANTASQASPPTVPEPTPQIATTP